jgi:uncharacterized protein YkwD
MLVTAAMLLPVLARADMLSVLSAARASCASGTQRQSSPSPLHEDERLDRAAGELARGATLARAMTHGTYRATHSAAIDVSGRLDDASVSRALITHYCSTLNNPRLRDVGIARTSGSLFIVLAEPLAVPRERDASAIDARILTDVNAARAAGRRCGGRYYPPAPPLTPDPVLAAAALDYSRTMARTGHFDHIGLDGSTPHTRVVASGYRAALVGENIAAGELSPEDAVSGWLASPGHCRNIMNPRFRDTGIGFAVNLAQHQAVYWTQEFAAPAR